MCIDKILCIEIGGYTAMNAIKRFGSAMIVPVLMFAFFGIVLGFATLFKNPSIM